MRVLIYIISEVKMWEISAPYVQTLRDRFPQITFIQAENSAMVHERIAEADIAFATWLTPEMVERAKCLKWVHSSAAAVTGMLALHDLGKRGITVTNSRGIQGIPIAENVMAGLLVLARRLDLTLAAQREKRWIQSDLCSTEWPWKLYGKAMTIVGLGSIWHRDREAGTCILGCASPRLDAGPGEPKPSFVDKVFGAGKLDEALSGCDVLVIAAPLLEATESIIGPDQLALLNRNAVFVNVARGQIVDETALIAALQEKHLGGAVLDVFHQEPLDSGKSFMGDAERRYHTS